MFNYLQLIFNILLLLQYYIFSCVSSKEENEKTENLFNFKELQFDSTGCGLTKGCLFKPQNCIPYKDCSYALSYISDNERVYFELFAQITSQFNVWAAIGFSVDGLMGGDTVTDCSSFDGKNYKPRLSYNPGKSNRKAPLSSKIESEILHTYHAKVVDGFLYCRFSQLIQPPDSVQSQFVRPLNSPIFILLASGVTKGKDLTIHSLNSDSSIFPFSSSHPIQLTQFNLSPEELINSDWNNNNILINSSKLLKPFNNSFENNSFSFIEQTTILESTTENSKIDEKSSIKILEEENEKDTLRHIII